MPAIGDKSEAWLEQVTRNEIDRSQLTSRVRSLQQQLADAGAGTLTLGQRILDLETELAATVVALATAQSQIAALLVALAPSQGIWTRSANQSIATGTPTPLSLDTEVLNVNGFGWAAGAQQAQVTVPVDGTYIASVGLQWDSGGSTAGNRGVLVSVNGVLLGAPEEGSPGPITTGAVTPVMVLTAGDYLEAQVFQTSGGALNVTGSLTLVRVPGT